MKIKFLVSKCNGHTIQYTARHTESNKATSNNLLAFKYCWKGHDNSILRKLHCQWAESVVGIENYTLEQLQDNPMCWKVVFAYIFLNLCFQKSPKNFRLLFLTIISCIENFECKISPHLQQIKNVWRHAYCTNINRDSGTLTIVFF